MHKAVYPGAEQNSCDCGYRSEITGPNAAWVKSFDAVLKKASDGFGKRYGITDTMLGDIKGCGRFATMHGDEIPMERILREPTFFPLCMIVRTGDRAATIQAALSKVGVTKEQVRVISCGAAVAGIGFSEVFIMEFPINDQMAEKWLKEVIEPRIVK
ncbi:MAG: hypothetical protein ACXWYM_00125 [Candidatus Binatia bacterium]